MNIFWSSKWNTFLQHDWIDPHREVQNFTSKLVSCRQFFPTWWLSPTKLEHVSILSILSRISRFYYFVGVRAAIDSKIQNLVPWSIVATWYMQSVFLGKSYRNSTPAKPCARGFWQKSSPSKRERLRKGTENYPRHWVNPRWWCVHCVEKYPRQLLHDATSTETNFRHVFLFCRFGWLAGCNFKVYVKQIMQTNVFSAWKWLEDYFPLF